MRRSIKFQILELLPLVWLIVWFSAAVIVYFSPDSWTAPDLSRNLLGPRWGHFLGFDAFGRDLQFSILAASLKSAAFAVLATLIACLLALVLGASIALAPALPRYFFLRAIDTFLAFPSLILALAWAAIRGPAWDTLLVALLIGVMPSFTRLIYARSREILVEPYILAAESVGASSLRILVNHFFPMLRSICAVKFPLLFAQALMAEATLSFLGVGAPIGKETWGSLLAAGREYLFEAPHIAFAAGIPLTITVLALQHIAARLGENPSYYQAYWFRSLSRGSTQS